MNSRRHWVELNDKMNDLAGRRMAILAGPECSSVSFSEEIFGGLDRDRLLNKWKHFFMQILSSFFHAILAFNLNASNSQ